MRPASIDTLPGYRRRLRVSPALDRVVSELEDDYHCMKVTLHHDGKLVTAIEPDVTRAPWTTCPGAAAVLAQTFTGVALDAFGERGQKRANCTHLHDLAVLAAAHAFDPQPLVYDILVSDPIEGRRRAELWRDGASVLGWVHVQGRIVEPAHLAHLTLDNMRDWIDSLGRPQQEPARLLRWGTMVANGRTIPMEKQSDARQMRAGSCYTFQPHRMNQAKRIGAVRDFSDGTTQPLDSNAILPHSAVYSGPVRTALK
jgi:hypothetical protein